MHAQKAGLGTLGNPSLKPAYKEVKIRGDDLKGFPRVPKKGMGLITTKVSNEGVAEAETKSTKATTATKAKTPGAADKGDRPKWRRFQMRTFSEAEADRTGDPVTAAEIAGIPLQ